MRVFVAILILIFAQSQAFADGTFTFPISCALGNNCFITSNADLNPKQGKAEDWTCGSQTKDGSGMMEVSLATILTMKENIAVLAAADGTVIDSVDGYADLVRPAKEPLPKGTPTCGNGIVLEHAGNWTTAYCNLKKGSVQVKKGQRVKAGQPIAAAGLSGGTRWPKLGFSALRNKMMIDPLSGSTQLQGCGGKPLSIFSDLKLIPAYTPFSVGNFGVSPMPVTDKDVRIGTAPHTPALHHDNAYLFLWANIMGVKTGDVVKLIIHRPNGKVLTKVDYTVKEPADAMPFIATSERPKGGFEPGTYTAKLTISRKLHATFKEISFAVR